MTAPAEIDPFAESGEKSPAISFKNAPIGTVITVHVTGSPKKIQGKEYGTDDPAVWKNKDGTTSPKYSAVINGTVDGEPRSVWATIPSDLFIKLRDAQQELGRSVRDGDVLDIKFVKEEPTKGDPKKIYAVRITPGTPPATGNDPFDDAAPPAQQSNGAAPSQTNDSGGWSDEPPF